jgi:hypothetical protein
MNGTVELVVRTLLIGAGATATMDLWAAALQRAGIPSLDLALLGRWIGHLPQGRFFHASIARSPAVSGELVLGWLAHYAIGIAFAALLLAMFGLDWARSPTLGPALLVGIVTVVAPLFVLQPALGAGIGSSRTPTPIFNAVKSLVTHTVYGVGLFLAARATSSLVPVGH